MGERIPLHTRTITIDAFETDDPDVVELVGTFQDRRPWLEAPEQDVVHRMTLTLGLSVSEMTITAAHADMQDYPHIECTDITPAFAGLVGLSIARGFNKEVQRRFIGVNGCTHLEFLARAIAPAAIQAVASARAKERIRSGAASKPQVMGYMKNTCHVWADDGPAIAKIEAGWRPGLVRMPTPSVVEIRRLVAEADVRDVTGTTPEGGDRAR